VFKGDPESVREWGQVGPLLCAMDDRAPFEAVLDERAFTLKLTSLDEEQTGAFVSRAVSVWHALVRGRLGLA
jgi:hypothetical protein